MSATSVVAAALSGVLCSGVTAAVMRIREPDVVAIRGPLQLTDEQRHLVELLADPGSRYVAASAGAEVAATPSLTTLGYVRGWTRTYKAGTDQLDTFVLEFATEDGAAGYARGLGGAARLLAKPVVFPLPEVPGASGLADSVRDSAGHYLRLVALSRGTRAALLVFRDDAAERSAEVAEVARRQYEALAP